MQDRIKEVSRQEEVRVEVRKVRARNKFEVFVGDDLVHSLARGDGFVDSKQKLDRIAEAVASMLEN